MVTSLHQYRKKYSEHVNESQEDRQSEEYGLVTKMHVCKLCGKRFGRPTTLEAHIRTLHAKTHHPRKAAQFEDCPHCNVTLAPSSMARHIRVKHPKASSKKESTCKKCNKTFGNLSGLRRHVTRMHPGVQRPAGDTSSPSKAIKHKHEDEHEKVTCTTCHRRFHRPSDLKRHKKVVHADQSGPFACHLCHKHFQHRSSKDRHAKTAHKK
ncbi:hypothetical protein BCR43DRAFT_346007 [Syncephalastrum racemosum]|uniref:C2H2-type domain-containing protein n=1 Tax=Syncephalastrum racemosum TaxID=13706 RepID=A0A1X2H5N6_SYNRA|nr:hypothetical protein BCR43DRAFT_346007 [Syncephalastrum racemosum]